jgi:hypothetical protein
MNTTKILAEMKDYLIANFKFPDMPPEKVIEELPNIWKHLVALGLLNQDDSYKAFVDSANRQYNLHKVMKARQELLDKFYKK